MERPLRIKRVLDTGASGVLAPMVETASEARETADEAREAVEAALPAGERPGTSRVRTNDYGRELAEQVERGDDPVTVALGDLPGRLRTLAA